MDDLGPLLGVFDHDDDVDSVAALRAALDATAALVNQDLPAAVGLHEAVPIRTADGFAVTADVLTPATPGPHPVLVFLHGGGWVWGSPRTHRKLTMRLAEAGLLVFSIDYRLAPEHPFPAAFADCTHAVHWAAREAPRFGGDPGRLSLAGDSAGANLAAAVAGTLHQDPGAPRLARLGLCYGVFDFSELIDVPFADLLVEAYLGPDAGPALLADPRVSPIHLARRLPPVSIVCGTDDPLIDQAERLRALLRAAKKEHEFNKLEDLPHAFLQMEFFPETRPAITRLARFLAP